MTEPERMKAIEYIVLQRRNVKEEFKAVCDNILEALLNPPALIVKSDLLLKHGKLLGIRADIETQLKDGIVILPSYLHATYVPKGVHIKYEWEPESEDKE